MINSFLKHKDCLCFAIYSLNGINLGRNIYRMGTKTTQDSVLSAFDRKH